MLRKSMLASLFLLTGVLAARAEYPDKPVKIVVPVAAGGGVDVMARLLAQHLGERLHQQFVVENRPGAAGVIGSKAVIASPADGATLLYTPSSLSLSVAINKTPPYDLAKDFSPIVNVAISPYALVVNPSVPAKSLEGVHRLRQGQSRQAQLRLGRRRQRLASRRRIAQEQGRDRDGARAEQGHEPGADRSDGRPGAGAVRQRPRPDVGEDRAGAADRDGGDEALGADAGPADHGRVRPAGLRGRQLGRACSGRPASTPRS